VKTLKGKTKELVAIGASIGTNCTGCLKHHLRLAREYGATDEEIQEAIEIALKIKKNSTHTIDKLIEETITQKKTANNDICC